MRYWEDFQSKGGFDDGDSVPPDAQALRYVYVREINRLAAKLKSKARLIAFDGCGMHNGLIIRRIAAKAVRNVQERELCSGAYSGRLKPSGRNWEDFPEDEAMTQAIAHFLCGEHEDLDELVEVGVRIRDEPELSA
jgi:hypothetical protein